MTMGQTIHFEFHQDRYGFEETGSQGAGPQDRNPNGERESHRLTIRGVRVGVGWNHNGRELDARNVKRKIFRFPVQGHRLDEDGLGRTIVDGEDD